MRTMTLSIVVASGMLLTWGAGFATAQGYLPGPAPGIPSSSVPGGSWSGYAPISPWEGYRPGLPWSGYSPPPGPTAATPPANTVPVSPPVVVSPYVARPAPGTTIARSEAVRPAAEARRPYFPGSRLMVPPSQYREYGTGRNVYMHKPWLPNQ